MKAVQLTGTEGFGSMRLVEVQKPTPGENQVLLEVKAAGINYAELEQTRGRYPAFKAFPFVMGFEAAGVVVEVGTAAKNVDVGDMVTAIVASGSYAEYATADASALIPIPSGISFAQASSIPVQGLSAYALLKFAAKPQASDRVLVQGAAGGVGIYLVQLAKRFGARQVIALASTQKKETLLSKLGADAVINYGEAHWPDRVKDATAGNGVDVVLEASSGEIGDESFKLLAPFGRVVIYGSRNVYDTLSPEKVQQLIRKNQSVIGFNFPSLRPEQIDECALPLLKLISEGKVKLYAEQSFPLTEVKLAYDAIDSRKTMGKVVLVP